MPSDAPVPYHVNHIDDIPPLSCPCGSARRAFTNDPDKTASLHVVETNGEAQRHYHKRMTEIYYVLDGEGVMELNDQSFDVRPGSTIMIKPGCRHRIVGDLRFINVPIPAFDPQDEYFD